MERKEGQKNKQRSERGRERCPPRPLVGLISGDWREHEWKSLWDVQPLEDWVGEVSERT